MRHIDLFSGIGGFALAAREVWGDEYENVCFCEINKYAQAVLRKNFGKGITIYGDIRGLTANTHSDRRTGRDSYVLSADSDEQTLGDAQDCNHAPRLPIDLLTGGFPCQPFSQAGKRKGTNDDRYLWPEMLRVIREFKPTWVVAENVRGLLTINDGMVFEQVCADLENEGYEVQPFVIPACAVNAPHRRDRVWIVANHHQLRPQITGAKLEAGRDRQNDQDAPNTRREHGTRAKESREPSRPLCGAEDAAMFERPTDDALNSESERLPDGDAGEIRRPEADKKCERSTVRYFAPEQWNQNWLEVATRFCGVDDGLPGDMDGVTLSKAGHRVERLKGLGNAIVPQVAVQIFRGLKMASFHRIGLCRPVSRPR